jgi:hypothetical protein
MEHSHLPFKTWYQALYLMSHGTQGISACEMRRITRTKRYEPIWYMMHKIRLSMSYQISPLENHCNPLIVETLIKVFKEFPGTGTEKRNHRNCRTSRLVLMKLNIARNHRGQGKLLKTEMIKRYRQNGQNGESRIYRALTTRYPKLVCLRSFVRFSALPTSEYRRVRSNAVAINLDHLLQGIYHGVSEKYLQLYLDEFCFRFNGGKSNNPFGDYLRGFLVWRG